MPTFVIRAVNSEFASRDVGFEYDRAELALANGVEGAVKILTDEIHKGKPNASVVVTVELPDGQAMLRSVVTLTVSSLMLEQGSAETPQGT